jgi:transcriptional regulator NrdR family protein
MKVIKKNGSIEYFDQYKIAKVAEATGLRAKEAEELAQKVHDWAAEQPSKRVTTFQIRNQVIKHLKKYHHRAADLYIWYEIGKDKELKSRVKKA